MPSRLRALAASFPPPICIQPPLSPLVHMGAGLGVRYHPTPLRDPPRLRVPSATSTLVGVLDEHHHQHRSRLDRSPLRLCVIDRQALAGSRSTGIQTCDRMSVAAPLHPVHNWRPKLHTHQSQATGRRAALRCGGAGQAVSH